MSHDDVEKLMAIVLIMYAGGVAVNVGYAMTEGIIPRCDPRPPREVIVVWQVLRGFMWPARIAWYTVYGALVSLAALVAFVRWAVRPESRVPKARVVK